MKLFIFVLVIAICLFPFNLDVTAQSHGLIFSNYNRNDGLASSTIRCFAQDSMGFIWIGTVEGLSRFDGYEFLNYRQSFTDKNSLSNNVITVIYPDSNNILWIGTDGGGVNRFDIKNEKFFNIKHDPNNENSLSSNDVRDILVDSNKIIWVGTYFGLSKIKFDSDTMYTLTNYKYEKDNINGIPGQRVKAITIDKFGDKWIGTDNGLAKIINSKEGIEFYNINDSSFIGDKCLHSDEDGNLWFGTYGSGLKKYHIKSKTLTSYLHA